MLPPMRPLPSCDRPLTKNWEIQLFNNLCRTRAQKCPRPDTSVWTHKACGCIFGCISICANRVAILGSRLLLECDAVQLLRNPYLGAAGTDRR